MWKDASKVFLGGTEQIKALYGKRIRAKTSLQGANVFDPAATKPQTINIAKDWIGFVARPHPTRFNFLLAFPTDQSKVPSTIEGLKAGTFKVVEINEPTFKLQFQVES